MFAIATSRIPSNKFTRVAFAPRRKRVAMSRRHAASDTEGLKVAQEVAHEAEEKLGLHHLDPVVGDILIEKDAEDASVWVFAFGSNMKADVLEGRRMIKPAESIPAKLPGFMLTFRQPGLPYREPGFATVEPLALEGGRVVHGVALKMTTTEWQYYKETEGAAGESEHGYGVITVSLEAYDGRSIQAYTLQTQAKSIAWLRGREALPSKRYIDLLRTGAAEKGLEPEYQRYLQEHPHYQPNSLGTKIGSIMVGGLAYGLLFPAFIVMRLYRKFAGLHTANKSGIAARLHALYFHSVFSLSWGIHDLLRPILGCGCSAVATENQVKASLT